MKYIPKVVCFISFIVSSSLFWLYWKRRQFPYNLEGRYFDEETATVYHQQVVEVSLFLAIIFTFISGILLRAVLKGRKQ
jgi:hypothetical protein